MSRKKRDEELEDLDRDYDDDGEDGRKLTRKERKAREKAKLEKQKELEKKLIKEGKIPVRYERRSFLWNALSIGLAFFLGIVAGLGGLIGGLYFVGKSVAVKDVLGTIQMEYTDYVKEDYADKSVIDLVTEIFNDFSSEDMSLETFGKYTPIVENMITGVGDQLSALGIELNVPELMATPFTNIGEYFQEEVIGNIQLGGVVGVTATSAPLMLALCYGTEGVDYTVEDGEIVMIEGHTPLTVSKLTENANDIINDLQLGDLLAVDGTTSAMMLALCYGTEGVDYRIDENNKIVPVDGGQAPTTIKDLMDDPSDILGKVQVEAVLDIDASSSAVMRYLAYGTEGVNYRIEGEGSDKQIVMLPNGNGGTYQKRTITSLTEDDLISDARIGDLIEVNEGDSGLMTSIQDWKIGDLSDQNKIEGLVIGDLFAVEDDSSNIMKAMSAWKIGDLKQQARIERLKISQLIEIDEDDPTTSRLMLAMKDWRIGDLSGQDKIDSLTLSDVLVIENDDAKILQALKDTPLGDFGTEVKLIPLSDLLEGSLEENDILRHLQNSTIETLSDDLQHLAVSQVFEDDLWSYAKNYDGTRPTTDNFIDIENHDKITAYYALKSSATEVKVTKGYYTQAGLPVTTEVKYDAAIAMANRKTGAVFKTPYYTETHAPVTAKYTYLKVDYSDGSLRELSADEAASEVKTDADSGEFYIEKNGERIDLERTVSYVYTGTDTPVEAEKRVYTQDGAHYVLQRTEVYEKFAAGNTLHDESDVEERFLYEDGERVYRYLSGAWYLLLAEEKDGATVYHTETAVLDLAPRVTQIAGTINSLTLGEMYEHEILATDPTNIDISKFHYIKKGETTPVTYLHELTITDFVQLINQINTVTP